MKTLDSYLSLEDRVRMCHERIPGMRHIEGFIDSGLIAPLPSWSPVPKKFQKIAQDAFSVWGLEAQNPKHLPEVLKPFVHLVRRGNKIVGLALDKGAYK